MARMNRLARWLVNRRTEARGRRVLTRLGTHLDVPASAKVLELGVGGGGLLAQVHDRFHPSSIVGTDVDPAQIQATRDFLVARWGSLPPTIELREVDALHLPFADGGFDLVFAMMMLHHVERRPTEFLARPQALAEIRRVLRPGGQLVYSDIFRRDEISATLANMGFGQIFLRSSWRSDLGIFRR